MAKKASASKQKSSPKPAQKARVKAASKSQDMIEEVPEEVSAEFEAGSEIHEEDQELRNEHGETLSDQEIESELDAQLEMELEADHEKVDDDPYFENDSMNTVEDAIAAEDAEVRSFNAKKTKKTSQDANFGTSEDFDTRGADAVDGSNGGSSSDDAHQSSGDGNGSDGSGDDNSEEGRKKKVQIEFPYSQLFREKVPRVFEVAETVAEEWVNDGNFENVPVGHPLAQITVAAGLRKAKEVEKKLEEKGVFAMAKMGLEYAKSQLNDKLKKK